MATATPQSQPTKPPVTLHPTAHLDPGAYVRGTHAISLTYDVLIHPRAHLVSLHGPVTIDSGTIICEKAVIGGPIPTATSSTDPNDITQDRADQDQLQTTIGPNVSIAAHAQIHAGATLKEACIIDAHAIVQRNVTVGAHTKIGAQCVIDRDVGPWEVVFSNGPQMQQRQVRRKRNVVADSEGGFDVVERARLKALETEREVTMGILRAAARASVGRKK